MEWDQAGLIYGGDYWRSRRAASGVERETVVFETGAECGAAFFMMADLIEWVDRRMCAATWGPGLSVTFFKMRAMFVVCDVAPVVAVPVGLALAVAVGVDVSVAVGDGVDVSVAVGDGVDVSVAVGVGVVVSVAVGVGVGVGVGVSVTAGVGVSVGLAVAVGVGVSVGDGWGVGVSVGLGVGVSVGLGVGVSVGLAVGLGPGVTFGVGDGWGVGVSVGLGDGCGVGVSVGLGDGCGVGVLVGLGVGLGPGVTFGVGRGVGVAPITVSATLIVMGEPTEGVIVTVAEYDPAFSPFILAKNLTRELAPELSLPPRGAVDNHPADGAPTVQFRLPPPLLVMVIACDGGLLLPWVPLKERLVEFTCMAGGVIVMLSDTVAGLPAVGWLVDGSIALTSTLMVNVC